MASSSIQQHLSLPITKKVLSSPTDGSRAPSAAGEAWVVAGGGCRSGNGRGGPLCPVSPRQQTAMPPPSCGQAGPAPRPGTSWLRTLAPHHHSHPQLLWGGHQEAAVLGNLGWEGEMGVVPTSGTLPVVRSPRPLRQGRQAPAPPEGAAQGHVPGVHPPHGVTTGPDTPDPLSAPGGNPWGRVASRTTGSSRLPLSAGATGELAVMSLDTSPGPVRTWSPHSRLQGGTAGTSRSMEPGARSRHQPCPPGHNCSRPVGAVDLGLSVLLGALEGPHLALAGSEVPTPTVWPLPAPGTCYDLRMGLGPSRRVVTAQMGM